MNGAVNTLTNNIGLGTLGEMVACPVGTKFADLATPVPGLSDAANATRLATCLLHFLDFEWRTTHPGPANPITGNNIITTLGVPTPLNMDSDPVPDVVATVLPLGINKFSLNFVRLVTPGDLPGTAELVITDPTGGSLPSSHIGVGIDSNGGRFPNQISVIFTLESFQAPFSFTTPPKFRLEIKSSKQPQHAGIFADLFDEAPDHSNHKSFATFGLGSVPLPAQIHALATMRTDKGIDLELGQSEVTTLDADAVLNAKPDPDGSSRSQHIHGVFTDMPTLTTVNYRPISPSTPAGSTPEQIDAARGGQTVRYFANSGLGALDVTYDDFLNPAGGGAPQPKIRAHMNIQRLPSIINLSQIGSVMDFDTPGDSIGQADAQFALNGNLIQLNTPRPGARLLRKKPTPTPTSPAYLGVAARIKGLHHVHLDQVGGRSVIDVGIERQPFDMEMRDEVAGITATGAIEDLPANAHVEYLPSTPSPNPVPGDTVTPLRMRYDAGGDTIGKITFKAAFDNTISSFVDQIEGEITDLPPVIDVSADMVGKVYKFNSSKPFGKIEALVRNKLAVAANTQPFLTPGSSGASAVIRNNGPFAARGRLYGLKTVTADLGNNVYHLEVGPVPLEIRADVDQVIVSPPEVLQRNLLVKASNIPSVVDVSFTAENDTSKKLIYDASDVIDSLSLSLTGAKLYAPEPRINRVEAGILGVPKHFEVGLGNAGNFDIVAGGDGIGGITGLITSGPDPAFPILQHRAYVQKDEDAIVAKVQVLGFTEFHLKKDPTDVILKNHMALPLHAEAWLDLNSGAANDTAPGALHPKDTAATLDIKDVPADMHINFDNASNKIHWDASSRINQIAAYGRIFQQVGPDLLKRELNASIDGIPKTIDVQISTPDAHHKKIVYDADGQTDGIHAKVTGEKLYAGEPKINRLQGDILSIPAHLDATLGDAGDFDVNAGTGIGSMTALVTSGPDPVFDPTRHQAYIETGNNIVGKAQLLGFKTFHMSKDPMHITFGTNDSYALFAEAHLDVDNNGSPETTADLDIEKVPATMDVNFVDDNKIEYTGSSGIDSITANAHVFQDPSGENLVRDLHAEFLGLPSHVLLQLDDPATDEKTVTYDANAPITKVALSLNGPKLYQSQSIAGQPAVNKVTAEIDNIPAHLAASFKTSGAMVIDAGAGLGAIKALVTSGPDPAFGANNHQAFVQNNAAGLAAKLQFLGFKKFTYDPTPMKAVLDTTASHPLVVDALFEQTQSSVVKPRTANLTISNIPSHVSFEQNDLSTTRKQYKYSANAAIASLDASLLGPDLYPGQPSASAKVNRLEAHVKNIPSVLTADMGSDGYIKVDAGSGIDSISALATSGPVPAVNPNDHVAHVELDGTQTVVQGQFLGFKSFEMTPSPMHVNLQTTASHKLDVDAIIDHDNNGSGELLANLTIDKVPATMDVSMADSGAVNYDASSAIDAIDFSATNLPGLPTSPAAIKTVSGNITHIPRHIDAGYGNNGRITFNARSGPLPASPLDGIGSITLAAASATPPALPTGLAASHAAFRQKGNQLQGEVKVSGLRQIDITPSPIDATIDTDVLAAFDIDGAVDADSNNVNEKSIVGKIRTDIHRVTIKQTALGAGKRIEATAGNGTNDIELHAVADNLPMGVNKVDATLTNISPVTRIDFGGAGSDVMAVTLGHYSGSTFISGNGDGIDDINVSVNNGVAPSTYQDDNNNTQTNADGLMVDMDSGNITKAALHLRGLRGVSFATAPNTQVGLDFDPTTGHPIALEASVDSKVASGFINKLPAHMLLDIGPTDDTLIKYSADQRIDEIALRTNWLDPKVKGIIAQIHNIPADFAVCVNSDGSRADCMRTNSHGIANEGDRLLSVAFETSNSIMTNQPNVFLKACFDASDCNSGKIATANVTIPRRIELEVGASAHGPTVSGYHCFDDVDDIGDIGNIPGDVACSVAYPFNALAEVLTTSGAHAFVYFDTGSTDLDGTLTYSIPPPVSVLTAPIVLTLDVPTINATDARLEVNANLQDIASGNGFVAGGSMSCSGGSLNLSTRFGFHIGDVNLPGALVDIINGAIDAYNVSIALIPGVPYEDHISSPIHVGDADVPINLDLISRIC